MVINGASLIVVDTNHLPDATTVASLAITWNGSRVSQLHKTLGPKLRVVATMAVAIKGMVVTMVGVVGRPVVGPMP